MELATLTDLDGMDSREIAKLTGKEHRNVMRDIDKMLEDMGEGGVLKFGHTLINPQNRQEYSIYRLPKRECLILASGYSVQLRAKIIDRWIELESKAVTAFKVPTSFAEALRLAAEQQETIEAQARQLEAQAPAVAFVDLFVEAKQTQPLRQVAKALKVPERKFVQALLDHKILFRLSGKLTPHADHMEAGRFEVKELVTKDGFATVQMRFTPRGVEWIAHKVQEWGLDTPKK